MRIRIVSSFLLCNPDDGYAGKRIPPEGQRRATWEGKIVLPWHVDQKEPDEVNEAIFRRFNVVEDGEREFLLSIGYNLPSLSAGDIVVWFPDEGRSRMFIVEGIGFTEIFPGLGSAGARVREGY